MPDETVVAMGGDGLVGALAAAVRGRGPLGVLPAGRGNDFARELKIPFDIPAPAACSPRAPSGRLDLGEANGQPFICIASTGFDSEANRIANEARFIKGNLVYAYAALRALVSWRRARFALKLDGQEHGSRAIPSWPPTRASMAAECVSRPTPTRPTECSRSS